MLLGAEGAAVCLLPGEPGVEAGVDLLGERGQLGVLLDREADQRDQIGQ